MNRRQFLIASGGTAVALAGGTAVATATRADILADNELTRGEGEAEAIERTITSNAVEYLESTNEVSENSHTEPFNEWARRESLKIGASAVVAVVENRVEKSVEGVGSGVRYLMFGPVITVDHTVTRDRDGSVVSKPNVTLDQLIAAAPRAMTVTITLEGQRFTNEMPVGVGHVEISMD